MVSARVSGRLCGMKPKRPLVSTRILGRLCGTRPERSGFHAGVR